MDLSERQDIVRPLFRNRDFLESLIRDFSDDESIDIYYEFYIGYSCWHLMMPESLYGGVGEAFGHWLEDEIRAEGIDVLTIRPYENGQAQGRKGTLSFRGRFGLVMSCDYDDDHVEPFEKEEFSPWKQKDFQGKSILVTSEIYSREEILVFLDDMFDIRECEATIIGRITIEDQQGPYMNSIK